MFPLWFDARCKGSVLQELWHIKNISNLKWPYCGNEFWHYPFLENSIPVYIWQIWKVLDIFQLRKTLIRICLEQLQWRVKCKRLEWDPKTWNERLGTYKHVWGEVTLGKELEKGNNDQIFEYMCVHTCFFTNVPVLPLLASYCPCTLFRYPGTCSGNSMWLQRQGGAQEHHCHLYLRTSLRPG